LLLNRDRADQKMMENGLEALIATSHANVFYTSDMYPYGKSFALLPLDRDLEPALVTPISGTIPAVLMSSPWFQDVRYYGEFYVVTRFAEEPLSEAERELIKAQESWEEAKESDPAAIITGMLEERRLTKGRIGIDETNLRHDDPFWNKVKTALPNVETVNARELFTDIRMVKTEEEIGRIQEATRITEGAWETSIESVQPGITEREFAETFQYAVISEGGNNSSYLGIYWPPVAFGRRTAFPDIAQPSDYRLERGDIIRFDGGCTYRGYPCDMARTAVFGEPGDKLERYWGALFKGEQKAVGLTRPGVEASTIFEAAVGEVRRGGIDHYVRHHTGHGWGIEGYDPPIISPTNHAKLEGGMVLCLETPYYEVGWGGILHEDIVVVTDGEPRYLTTFEGALRVVG
jgi:Xaa-Pro aminopeptidase